MDMCTFGKVGVCIPSQVASEVTCMWVVSDIEIEASTLLSEGRYEERRGPAYKGVALPLNFLRPIGSCVCWPVVDSILNCLHLWELCSTKWPASSSRSATGGLYIRRCWCGAYITRFLLLMFVTTSELRVAPCWYSRLQQLIRHVDVPSANWERVCAVRGRSYVNRKNNILYLNLFCCC